MDTDERSSKQRRQEILDTFSGKVQKRGVLRLRGQKQKEHTLWFGLGMFGVVGWSVAIPTLIGVALGIWIDGTWPSRFSWTLMFLVAGVALGCLNAWYWVRKMGIRSISNGED